MAPGGSDDEGSSVVGDAGNEPVAPAVLATFEGRLSGTVVAAVTLLLPEPEQPAATSTARKTEAKAPQLRPAAATMPAA